MTKESILKQYFGYDAFRPYQADIIDTVLSGQDCLVIMPTGGGKSVCFQVPALLTDGLAIVISPLIALMKDQVEALKANGVAAEYLNSTLTSGEQQRIEQACVRRQLKILYISPEKLFSNNYLTFIKSLKISLFAVDESHCVSFWGPDFRPEYAQLGVLKEIFPRVPLIALTATADKVTRKDILQQLRIPEAPTFVASFDRPNLSLSVLPGRNRLKTIQDFLLKRPAQSGIIYCLARTTTESVAAKLREAGFEARHYHAGMESGERARIQEAFLRDDIGIMVATIAFGMGIDKSNVRWVIHYNLPKNMESFYQEIGRAGRDGLPSDTLLLYSYADVMAQMKFNEELPPERKLLLNAKLERMRQYAESSACRRRILMSYFNEAADTDCGNCDACRSPKSTFDGTVIAQKALSAIARSNEKVGMTMLINILRGSFSREVSDRGYHQLKTFGSGKELRFEEWAEYLSQLLNSGIMDIAYDEGHTYKLNALSWEVLRQKRMVPLFKFVPFAERQLEAQASKPERTKKEVTGDAFFEVLRALRKQLADAAGIPPYIIFTDATLHEIAEKKPITKADMLAVSGVGQEKFARYGEAFINAVLDFAGKNKNIPRVLGIDTVEASYQLYSEGLGLEEIAARRNLVAGTVCTHLQKAQERGQEVDWQKFITPAQYQPIHKALRTLGWKKGETLKPVFEFLGEEYSYLQLNIAAMLLEKQAS